MFSLLSICCSDYVTGIPITLSTRSICSADMRTSVCGS
nr:MAG TPA: hypothetical protein [Caudoviricetes sp.]